MIDAKNTTNDVENVAEEAEVSEEVADAPNPDSIRITEISELILKLRAESMTLDDSEEDEDRYVEISEEVAVLKNEQRVLNRKQSVSKVVAANKLLIEAIKQVLADTEYSKLIDASVTSVLMTIENDASAILVNPDFKIRKQSGTRGEARPLKNAFELFASTADRDRLESNLKTFDADTNEPIGSKEYKHARSHVEYLVRDKVYNSLTDAQKQEARGT